MYCRGKRPWKCPWTDCGLLWKLKSEKQVQLSYSFATKQI